MVMERSKAGYRDWLAQRVTAVLIGAYTIFLLVYFLNNPSVSYQEWYGLFHHVVMKMATFVVLLSIMWHAWIGLWTVFTDYVKPKAVRLLLEIIVGVLLIAYLGWILEILWG